MKKIFIGLCLLLTTSFLFFGGCGSSSDNDDSNNTTDPQDLVGSWVFRGAGGDVLEMNEDGTYHLSQGASRPNGEYEDGTWQIDGSDILFVVSADTDGDNGFGNGADATSIVGFTVTADNLTLITDSATIVTIKQGSPQDQGGGPQNQGNLAR